MLTVQDDVMQVADVPSYVNEPDKTARHNSSPLLARAVYVLEPFLVDAALVAVSDISTVMYIPSSRKMVYTGFADECAKT